jgi:MFS superfamily sulfate permease-like transporter
MFDPKYLKNDLFAGLVVFLVSLPLCLGIALASEAPLFSGIIAGIIGGMVVTTFSRCTLGVSGPAAGLAVIVAQAVGQLGFEAFLLASMVAGLIQITAGFLRLGIISHYFPSSVIKGLLAGIGLILVLKQIPHAVGYDTSWMGEMEFREADGHNTLSELYYMFQNLEPGAIIIAIFSLIILVLWEGQAIKKNKVFKLLPAPLIVVFLGIALNEVYHSFVPQLYLESTHLVNVPVSNSLGEFFSFFTLADFSQWNNVQVYEIAFTLAIIASIESLLVVEATDKLDPEKRVTPTNLELKAQGIGNMITGLIGGLPITQVIVRSAANVEAGGKTRLSAFLHGAFLLLSAMLIPGLLNKIPLSALAAILLVVGYKLTRISLYKEMAKKGRWQFIPFIVTVGALVFTDMLTGVILGLAVGAFHILMYNYKVDYLLEKRANNTYTLHLSEYMSFLNKAGVMNVLRDIPANSMVTVDASRTEIIDSDVHEVISNFVKRAKGENITIEWKGLEGKDL